MRLKLPGTQPCYCAVCDAPNSLRMEANHEKPGFEHITLHLALCRLHTRELYACLRIALQSRRWG